MRNGVKAEWLRNCVKAELKILERYVSADTGSYSWRLRMREPRAPIHSGCALFVAMLNGFLNLHSFEKALTVLVYSGNSKVSLDCFQSVGKVIS